MEKVCSSNISPTEIPPSTTNSPVRTWYRLHIFKTTEYVTRPTASSIVIPIEHMCEVSSSRLPTPINIVLCASARELPRLGRIRCRYMKAVPDHGSIICDFRLCCYRNSRCTHVFFYAPLFLCTCAHTISYLFSPECTRDQLLKKRQNNTTNKMNKHTKSLSEIVLKSHHSFSPQYTIRYTTIKSSCARARMKCTEVFYTICSPMH